ncbi:AraC family transcriptional regulator [Haloechinothrix salitolerans]|uniref:AraC family transcriptional regulator n=1 Tax=Haloechinothrix salitolerans TaxID=926830 RepID=A0ABW2BZL6_9PSEU
MARLPLHRYKLFHSMESTYVNDMVGRILGPHRLTTVDASNSLDAKFHTHRLTDVSISFLTYGTEVVMRPDSASTYFAIHLPLTGTSTIGRDSDRFLSTPAVALVISPGDDVPVHWHSGCAKLIVRIERSAVEARLASLLGDCVRNPLRFERKMDTTHGAGACVSNALRHLAAQLDRERGLFDNEAVGRAFERMLITELLLGHQHNYSDQLNAVPSPATSREVDHAVALLESSPERPHTVMGLAEQVAVSARSLQRGFHVQLGTTFQQVLHDIRLRRVHDELRAAHPDDVTVSEVMAKWRLPVKGQTYAAYRRRYGETPMRTLKRGT